MFTGNVIFAVTPLVDNEVAFANAAAWNNYWNNISATVDIDAAATTIYTATAYDNALVPVYLNIDGVNYVVPTTAMFTSLMNRVDALNTAFELMRTQLLNAGMITNAQ